MPRPLPGCPCGWPRPVPNLKERIHATLLPADTSGERTIENVQAATDIFERMAIDPGLYSEQPMVAADKAVENEAAWGLVDKGHTLVNPHPCLYEDNYQELLALIYENVLAHSQLAPLTTWT